MRSPDARHSRRGHWLVTKLWLLFLLMAFLGQASCGNTKMEKVGMAAVSPDGASVLFCTYRRGKGCMNALNISTGKITTILSVNGSLGDPAFTADGTRVVFWQEDDNGQGQLMVLQRQGNKVNPLIVSSFSDTGPCIGPDGHTVAFIRAIRRRMYSMGGKVWDDADVWLTSLDGEEPKRVTNVKAYLGMAPPSFTKDGHGLYLSWTPHQSPNTEDIHMLDLHTKSLKKLTYGPWINDDPAVSPDGSTVVFVSDRVTRFQYELWRMRPDGSQPLQITHIKRRCSSPRFFPDGRSLVFWIDEKELWRINLDGTGLRKLYGL